MNRTKLLRSALLAASALTAVGLSRPAAAQSDAQIQAIENQIKALQSELQNLKKELGARDRAVKAAQEQAKAAQDKAAAAQGQAAAAQAQAAAAQAQAAAAPPAAPATPPKPPLPQGTFQVGGVTVTLGGFTAAEGVWRSRNQAASINSSFNTGIPFRNSPNYYIPEFRLTAQQSRISLLAQGQVDDATKLAGYFETDFLSAGSSSNSNESNSYTLRIRQAYATYTRSDLDMYVLGGQAWSLATMYRIGLVPRQENVPLTIDAQYVVGFNWARQAQLRVVKGFDDNHFTAGLSLEEPQTTFSSSVSCPAGTQPTVPGGTLEYTQCGGPNVNSLQGYSDNNAPDVIAKIAADPGFGHYELYGLMRFLGGRVSNVGGGTNYNTVGGGIGGGLIVPVISKRLDFQVSGLVGSGIGRYGSAQLPDATFNAAGKIEPLQEYQIMGGFVGHPIPAIDIYAYAGAEQTYRSYETVGKTNVGYGNPNINLAGCGIELSPLGCSANTSGVVEGTIGFWWRFLKGSYGTMQLGAQYEYVGRNAFSGLYKPTGVTVPPGSQTTPTSNENMFLFSFRYLPFQ
jgi:hypothetical protein